MDREKLFRQLENKYISRKELMAHIPLGIQPDELWHELVSRRRSVSTILPLYNHKGAPYWFVPTQKMVSASEKIVETLYENEVDIDPYTDNPPLSSLEEAFFTSYVEGAQISLQNAMTFLSSGNSPGDIEEQMIFNNRLAAVFASANLYRSIDTGYMQELIYYLTDGMDGGGQEFRSEDMVDMSFLSNEAIPFSSAHSIPEKMDELSTFLRSNQTHPLIKAAVAQANLITLHPFPEGNERLGRLLSNIILTRSGYAFFGDISLSAIIARKSYGYYEAMLNILRGDSDGDLTYFIEYYLELLSRGIDERTLILRRREEGSRQKEREMAHTSLTPAVRPAIKPEHDHDDDVDSLPASPEETLPANDAEEGDILDGFYPVGLKEQRLLTDEENSRVGRIKGVLHSLGSRNGKVMKKASEFLLSILQNNVITFTTDELGKYVSLSGKKMSNLIVHLRDYNIIRSTGQREGRYMLYEINVDYPPLTRQDYSPELLEYIYELRFKSKSPGDKKIGEILNDCLPNGVIALSDYDKADPDLGNVHNTIHLAEQTGIIERLSADLYKIRTQVSAVSLNLNNTQKSILSQIYNAFGFGKFTSKAAQEVLPISRSYINANFHQLSMLRAFERETEDNVFVYRLAVDPNRSPHLFDMRIIGQDKSVDKLNSQAKNRESIPASSSAAYSREVLDLIDELAQSQTSRRDKRLGNVLMKKLDKGMICKKEYDSWGYTDNMWIDDISLAEQLGLITKKANDVYHLNHQLDKKVPLLPGTIKTITEIYETFGDKEFSHEMFIASLNYSPSYTYASLHKLTLLRILEQSTGEEGSQFKLLVNPHDHPECFEDAA